MKKIIPYTFTVLNILSTSIYGHEGLSQNTIIAADVFPYMHYISSHRLDQSHQNYVGPLPKTLQHLKNCQKIILSHNALTGTVGPNHIVDNATHYFDHNQLTALDLRGSFHEDSDTMICISHNPLRSFYGPGENETKIKLIHAPNLADDSYVSFEGFIFQSESDLSILKDILINKKVKCCNALRPNPSLVFNFTGTISGYLSSEFGILSYETKVKIDRKTREISVSRLDFSYNPQKFEQALTKIAQSS